MSLTERYEAVETLSTYGENESFRICILDGNPSDSTLAETMIDRQVELYERAPRQVAYDGAFSSKANLEAIKGKGVEDVAFTKAHFAVTDMVKSSWVYQRLRRFRCGIEGVISFFETSLWSRPMHMALIAFF